MNVACDVLPKYFPCPMLLWLPLYVLQNFARFAPDLWSWRTGVFSFEPPAPEEHEAPAPQLKPAGGTTSVDNYSKAFKEAEITFLTPILEAVDLQTAAPPQLRKHAENAFLLAEYHYSLSHYKDALAWVKKSKYYFEQLEDAGKVAVCHRFIGLLHQSRGDSAAALREYEASLQIAEELGDLAVIANSKGQIARLFEEREKYKIAFDGYLYALKVLIQLQSADALVAIPKLRRLRSRWGANAFDAAWWDAAGEPVPEGMKE